ncbi:MAG TPA: class I SAM-dependent methyltransferase [Noviherbaspirillum sp.]|uniref:class I SAM-dependent methyltransferase n=1 Tax=Noviherbaspirillum sp. TaxID=1926288 RepID=UPI002B475FDD|nr:class I SAM-dependent methyltransferase [Noviherbaspirillum sp.]HJV88310.1 class I SAM-dependent methyltransferase [Noviherbaspirillum sp.]
MQNASQTHAFTDQPSPWVQRFAALIPDGEVLDLACGGGRHARLLASLGHPVVAVDRDSAALRSAAGPLIETQQIDLEVEGVRWPFSPGRFAGIVVTNYLHRPLLPHILHSLAPGGVLIYETFAQGNEHFGKPSNPLFLLRTGELLELVAGVPGHALRILAFEDGYVESPKPAMVQRICATRADSHLDPQRLRLN